MKLSYSALMGILALASSGITTAETTIYFSASNGDRNATQVAISRILTAWNYRGLTNSISGAGGPGQASNDIFRTSNFGTWRGTWNSETVVIKTNFAGALSGIAAVADQTIEVRFDPTNGSGSGAIPENPLTSTNPANYIEESVDFGLSTNFQSTSPFNGNYNGRTYNPIKQIPVGISQLGFYGSPGIPIDSITTQQAKLLYDTGSAPLALFTGLWLPDDGNPATTNDGHALKYIYALGRNTDAGQRFGAQLEIGRSGIGTQFVYQPNPAPTAGGAGNVPLLETSPGVWEPNPAYVAANSFVIGTSVIGGIVSDHRQWNNGVPQTFSGITSSGGYDSGANLAVALTHKLGPTAYKKVNAAATDGWYIGYVTPGDANATILGNGQGAARPADTKGVALKFNGIENTADNVKNGKYTLWVYNRILTPLTGVTPKAGDPSTTFRQDFVNALRDRIKIDVASQQGIALSDVNLKVFRTADGGTVFPGTLPPED